MMKTILLVVALIFGIQIQAQSVKSKQQTVLSSSEAQKAIKSIKTFQKNLNEEYLNPKESPLRGDHFTNFKKHLFFPIDLKYRVIADFKPIENSEPFDLPTSSGKAKRYRAYATATFHIDGKSYSLIIYQSLDLIKLEEYKNHLFLPFKDETNGIETYGGGKYIDLTIPKNNTIVIDFNQSYQPYCAYNAFDYNCPIVPSENTLSTKILAGVQYEDIYH